MTCYAQIHQRQPCPEWIQRLREISPKSDVHSWLYLHWFASRDRWVVYEMVPTDYVEPDWVDELQRSDPEEHDDWEKPHSCSPFQWAMWREHRVHARPCWVIQGQRGGHIAVYDKAEKELAKALQLPLEPPKVGALPYAPFDERTVQQLIRRNKLAALRNNLHEFRRQNTNAGVKAQTNDAMKEARRQMIQFLEEQMQEASECFVDAYRKGEWEGAPVSSTDWEKVDEESTNAFIETGSLSATMD